MEEQWQVDRAELRRLLRQQPQWSNLQLAQALKRSLGWIKKWKVRLRAAPTEDETVLRGHSRVRQHLPAPFAPAVIDTILHLRDQPPAALNRRIGPKTIGYYLHQDATLQAVGCRLPRSPSTIWKILDQHQRIARRPRHPHTLFPRSAPLQTWEIDFTDVVTAHELNSPKQQHQVENFNVVDRGTSLWLDAQVSSQYDAEQALLAIASTLVQWGLPQQIVCDRDVRWVGSWSGDDFPSAFVRFLLCLGIEVDVCPPHRPDRKPFVERLQRAVEYECVRVYRPATAQQAREVLERWRRFYNDQRPHQGDVCHNQPPTQAFPRLPVLTPVPEQVDPSRWLDSYHGRYFRRRVSASGSVKLGKCDYYLRRELAGRLVVLKLDAHQRQLHAQWTGGSKTLKLKGIHEVQLDFEVYLALMLKEARAEWRVRQQQQKNWRVR